MKQMKVYTVYVDDGANAYRLMIPAQNEKEAKTQAAGSGEIVAVKQNDGFKISCDKLARDLARSGWGQDEIDVISRLILFQGLSLE